MSILMKTQQMRSRAPPVLRCERQLISKVQTTRARTNLEDTALKVVAVAVVMICVHAGISRVCCVWLSLARSPHARTRLTDHSSGMRVSYSLQLVETNQHKRLSCRKTLA